MVSRDERGMAGADGDIVVRIERASAQPTGEGDRLEVGIETNHGPLAPEVAGRPVDGGAVALEQGVPVDRLAAAGGRPEGAVLRVVPRHLQHVVAGAEAEALQRVLEGERAGAAEARADDVERHAATPPPAADCPSRCLLPAAASESRRSRGRAGAGRRRGRRAVAGSGYGL